MYHTHFNSIHSTQIYLRDNLVELKNHDHEILISASEQTLGVGRKGSQWDAYEHAITMSFTLKPNPVPTLTPIEIGVLTSQFIKQEYGEMILLKWPNDLLTTEGKKCGGILAQYIDSETVIAGLGLNLGPLPLMEIPSHYKHGLGQVSQKLKLSEVDKKEIPARLYSYLLKNRIQDSYEMQKRFKEACFHINNTVEIDDDGFHYEGIFLGIGLNGEALVEIDGQTRAFLSSSLKILGKA